MSRKPHITQFFLRDKKAFTALSKVGHISPSHFSECGVVPARLKNYVKDGLVEKVVYKDRTEVREAYKLTDKGKELAERNWALSNHYHAQSPYHDLAMADKYFSLPEPLRDGWMCETEVRRDLFNEHLKALRDQGRDREAELYADMLTQKLISMPDAVYTNEQGRQVAFEVVTNNYGEAELLAKETFVSIMGTQYETTRV